MSEQALADWEDPRTQAVYEILCDPDEPPNPEEHWEGWKARRIVAALSGWQPIEMAPKDKSIIVWDDGIIGEGYYDVEDGSWWWANVSRHDYTGSPIYPTLWQPLPAPPVEAKSD